MRFCRLATNCLAAIALSLLPASCGPNATAARAPSGPAAIPVTVAPVQIRSVQRSIEATGTLFGDEETFISSQASGRVVQIFKDLGDPVLPGEPLAQIDRRDYELALAQSRAGLMAALAKLGLAEIPGDEFDPSSVPTVASARAEAANAQARLDRGRQLYEESPPMISAQDFADLQTAWEVASHSADVALLNARASLADARTRAAEAAIVEQRLTDTTVRAPGQEGDPAPRYQVAARSVSLGEYVNQGKTMFSLIAGDPISFRATVPERFAGAVNVGQDAEAIVEAYGDPFRGVVARVSPRIDAASRTFEVEINIPNPEGRLKPGAFAHGNIVTRTEDGVTFVPEGAVVTFAGVQKVFTVKDGKAVEHRVQTGVRQDGQVEIVGAFGAESVVVTGAASLSNNAPVTETK